MLHDRFGIRRALMSTVHSYTESQRLLDLPHPDPRRARAAALNIIPTSTTATEALARLTCRSWPGGVDGFAVRVPTPAVACSTWWRTSRADPRPRRCGGPSARPPQGAARRAPRGDRGGAGLLRLHRRSALGRGRPAARAGDVDGRLARVVAWYDNEWGYANRLADLLERIATLTQTGDDDDGEPADPGRSRPRRACAGKRVFVRVDFNVPSPRTSKVVDATRLEEAIPTMRELCRRRRGADPRLPSRPAQGRSAIRSYSLRPVADELGRLLGRAVAFAADCVGEEAEAVIRRARPRRGRAAREPPLPRRRGEERSRLRRPARRPGRGLRRRRLRRRPPRPRLGGRACRSGWRARRPAG